MDTEDGAHTEALLGEADVPPLRGWLKLNRPDGAAVQTVHHSRGSRMVCHWHMAEWLLMRTYAYMKNGNIQEFYLKLSKTEND